MPYAERKPALSAERRAFGQRLGELRRKQRMSQEELAHHAGLDRSYVGGVERGDRNVGLDNIHRLARGLGVQPSELF